MILVLQNNKKQHIFRIFFQFVIKFENDKQTKLTIINHNKVKGDYIL